jgi:hypothetical protein
MKKTLYGALAVALGLSAAVAGAQVPAPSPNQCTTSTCRVFILMPADCGSGITVSPDPLVVKGAGSVKIEWTVLNPGWDLDSIVLHGDGEKDFTKSPVKGKTLTAETKARTGKLYKYDVTVKKGEAKCTLDPTVMN